MSAPARLGPYRETRTEFRVDVKSPRGKWLVWRPFGSEDLARKVLADELDRVGPLGYELRLVTREVEIIGTAWTKVPT